MVAPSQPQVQTNLVVARWIDRRTIWAATHWLVVAQVLVALGVVLPVAAAWLQANDAPLPARLIFLIFASICHQRPDHSFFLWGEQMAICQRDTAILAAALIAGLVYTIVRDRMRPLRWSIFLLLIAPMAIDGLTQLLGWRESTWELRVVTGALFGIAAVWLVYPLLEGTAAEIRASVTARGAQTVADSAPAR